MPGRVFQNLSEFGAIWIFFSLLCVTNGPLSSTTLPLISHPCQSPKQQYTSVGGSQNTESESIISLIIELGNTPGNFIKTAHPCPNYVSKLEFIVIKFQPRYWRCVSQNGLLVYRYPPGGARIEASISPMQTRNSAVVVVASICPPVAKFYFFTRHRDISCEQRIGDKGTPNVATRVARRYD